MALFVVVEHPSQREILLLGGDRIPGDSKRPRCHVSLSHFKRFAGVFSAGERWQTVDRLGCRLGGREKDTLSGRQIRLSEGYGPLSAAQADYLIVPRLANIIRYPSLSFRWRGDPPDRCSSLFFFSSFLRDHGQLFPRGSGYPSAYYTAPM